MNNYRPVSCALHSGWELAVMHGDNRVLRWKDATGRACAEALTPVDLVVRERAEYLHCRDTNGHSRYLRLDRILSHP